MAGYWSIPTIMIPTVRLLMSRANPATSTLRRSLIVVSVSPRQDHHVRTHLYHKTTETDTQLLLFFRFEFQLAEAATRVVALISKSRTSKLKVALVYLQALRTRDVRSSPL
jgi:hypothetical protein